MRQFITWFLVIYTNISYSRLCHADNNVDIPKIQCDPGYGNEKSYARNTKDLGDGNMGCVQSIQTEEECKSANKRLNPNTPFNLPIDNTFSAPKGCTLHILNNYVDKKTYHFHDKKTYETCNKDTIICICLIATCKKCDPSHFSLGGKKKCKSCGFWLYRDSEGDGTSCPCVKSFVIIPMVLICFLLLIASFRKLLWYMKKYPGAIGGTVASVSIITSHAQMMLVVFQLDLKWPVEVKKAESVLYSFTLDLPHVFNLKQCLIKGSTLDIIWILLLTLFLLLMFLPNVLKFFSWCSGFTKKDYLEAFKTIDKVYNIVALMMSFFIIRFTSLILSNSFSNAYVTIGYALGLFYITFKFFRDSLVLNGTWDGKFYCILKPVKLSKKRLNARVSYLAKRYGPHAPYWQFIIWARQISILILARMVEKNWLLVLIGTLICLASISIHAKVKPFKYDFQNKMELWLMYVVTVIVISAGIYSEILKTWIKNNPAEIARWIFSLILLGGMFGSLLGATIYFRLFRKIYGSFHDMLKDRRRSSFIQIFKDEIVEELTGEEISRIITSARDNDNCWQTFCKRVSFLPFVVLIAAIIISFAEGSLALGVFLTLIFIGSIIFYRYIAKKLAIRFKARKGRFSTVDESILYSSSDEDNDRRSSRFSTFDEEESILYSSDDGSSVYSSDDQEYCISEEDAFQEQDDGVTNIM